jgi:hypothetical protein
MHPAQKVLTNEEFKFLGSLTTPKKIQDYLDTLPINHEKKGDTYMSPRRVLREKKAMCFEGSLLASLCLWIAGYDPYILDLKSYNGDDHTVALYKINGYWGAISKTNHCTLRFRDPIYKTVRELACSYFHEYFDVTTGEKILRSFSKPWNVKKLGLDWIVREDEMHDLAEALDKSPHLLFFPQTNLKYLRRADKMELKAGRIIEWKNSNKRT